MTLQNESRPVATGGFDKSSLLGGLDNREIARKFVSAQAAYPSADDVRRAIIRELFAEAVTIAIGFGLNCLRASQYGDDESVLAEFRLFHAASRTATECARELRGLVEEGA